MENKILQKNVTNNNDDETKLPLSDRIILNSPVTSIVWNDDSEQVNVTAGNVVYTADLVLVTVSLGVLKDKADSMFIPKLPEATIRAVNVIFLLRIQIIRQYRIFYIFLSSGSWIWHGGKDLSRV